MKSAEQISYGDTLRKAISAEAAGRIQDALDLYEACLMDDPACAEAHYRAARMLQANPLPGLPAPDFAAAWTSDELMQSHAARIQELQAQGHREEALERARVLCMADPKNSECWIVAGILALGLQRHDEAIGIFKAGLERSPDDLLFRMYLLKTLYFSGFDRYDEAVKRWLSLFLKQPETIDVSLVSRLWLSLLRHDPAFEAVLKGAECAGYDSFWQWFSHLPPQDITALTDDYFLDGIRHCVVADTGVEQLLVYLRRAVLDEAAQPGPGQKWAAPLGLALAEQCFINEYVWDVTEEEARKVDALAGMLAKRRDATPLEVAAFACYRLLYAQPRIAKAARTMRGADGEAVRSLLRQQVSEPGEELALARRIKSFSKIRDNVSQKVRDQYEDNPYPRWVSIGRLPDSDDAMVLDQTDRMKKLDILIAGCATGHFPVRVSMNYPLASVTGIDLSLASLAYGQRKAREMGADNIEFLHGDILDAGKLKKKFDIIFSIGVLHHMRDPEQGWQALVEVLKPGGLMKLGFYSLLERQHIEWGRRYVAEHKLPATPEGIRAMRRAVKALPEGHPLRKIIPFNDFYSTSMMRDLLFHVQEQSFTVPRIKADLERFGLEFLNFPTLASPVLAQYRAMFPDDPAMTNLDSWDKFEHAYPDTFTGLCQFWCRKK